MRLRSLGLFLRTARHLGLGQAGAWCARPLRRFRLQGLTGTAPPLRSFDPKLDLVSGRRRTRQWLTGRIFSAHGVTRPVETAADWNPGGVTRLWTYLLHYHDDLRDSQDRGLEQQIIRNWIAGNPPARGPGWEPYPLSRRIANWIYWLLVWRADEREPLVLASLAWQARALERQIEQDLQGNHLWANAKGLIFAGCFFGGPEGDRWLEAGVCLLQRELGRQVHADGGHVERSPLYHAIALEDLLDVLNLSRVYPEQLAGLGVPVAGAAEAMFGWLAVMTAPDGCVATFGDTVSRAAPGYDDLARYALRLRMDSLPRWRDGGGVSVLAGSGYVRLDQGATSLWFDRGGPAPDYQPGHSHAGSLAFELSWRGERILVNPGISTYERGPVRDWERSTEAHNTLRLDHRDQSEMWAAFRVGRRARTRNWKEGCEPGSVWAEAEHDGYAPARHHRRVELGEQGARLVVTDTVFAPRTEWRPVELYFYLAPGWSASCEDGNEVRICGRAAAGETIVLRVPEELAAFVEPAYIGVDFGQTVPTQRIRLAGPVEAGPHGAPIRCSIEWENHANPVFRGQFSARAQCPSLAGV